MRARESKGPGWQIFRREERHEFRYHLSIAVAFTLSWIVRLIPATLRGPIADRAGDLFFRLSPTYRGNVSHNIAQVTAAPVDSPDVAALARRVFRASARNFADLLLVPHMSAAEFRSKVRLVDGDWEYLEGALAEGRGVVLVSGHTGSFDYVGQLLNARGYPLHVVTGRTTARFIFDAVTYLRAAKGVTLWEPTPSGVRHVIQAIRRGECAVFLCDRDFFQNGKPVTLFGKKTTLPPGAVRIARETGAAVVPIFGLRSTSGYGVRLFPAFRVPKTDDLEADLRQALDRVAAIVEQVIGANPDQWAMFQRVWPAEPAPPVRVFPVGSPLETDIVERIGAALPRRHPRR